MMQGHPILGTISGFFFGLFLGMTLFMFGVIPLHSSLLWILPIIGVLLGLFMAAWAPFGKGDRKEASTDSPPSSDIEDHIPESPTGQTIEFDVVESPETGTADNDA